MKKWTKKDIKYLCGRIDAYFVFNRSYYPAESIAALISKKRQDVVLHGCSSFLNALRARASESREAAEHARKSGVWGEATERVASQQDQLAAECEKDIAKLKAMIARIEREGLPPEVVNYWPEYLPKVDAGASG